MHRYEHSSRMGSDFDKLSGCQTEVFGLCERFLADIMLGRSHPVRYTPELARRAPPPLHLTYRGCRPAARRAPVRGYNTTGK